MDTNTVKNDSGMTSLITCTTCWKNKLPSEVAQLNGKNTCTRCVAKRIKFIHNKKLKICKDCGNSLSLIESGAHILWTCTQCPVEFGDAHELTKDWIEKLGDW
jgi:DNA-directed RNA polymerase subunit RPC12/RpoP